MKESSPGIDTANGSPCSASGSDAAWIAASTEGTEAISTIAKKHNVPVLVDAAAELAKAAAKGTLKTWMSGPLASEFRVVKALNDHLSVTLDGRTRKVEFSQANILDSARAAGLPAPFACKAGVCATCRAKVTSGKVEMAARYGLTDEEVAAGYVLTCQSVPVGDGLAVDYDA